MNFKKIACIITAGLMLTAIVGCKNKSQSNTNTKKDSLVLAVGTEPEAGYDPTKGWGHTSMSIIHSVLYTRDKDMNVVGDLAADYKIDEAKTTWTVKIKPGLKFSDGSPIKASDVAYSFETAKNNKDSNIDLTMIESISSSDDTTVVFKLKEPQSFFVDKLMKVGIVPEAVHKANPTGFGDKPIGSGPYVLKQWDKGQQAIFERNENYYGKKPKFKQITLLFLEDDAVMAAVQSGKVDMAKVDYTFASTKVNGMVMKEIPSVENIGICFPMPTPQTVKVKGKDVKVGHAVTSDIAIRKALNVAFSRKEMIKGILNGYGTPAYTGYEQMPWNNGSTIKDGDLEGAKKILADAGWKDINGDGIIEKNGVKAEFDLFYTYKGARQSFAVYIAENAKKLGISINPIYKTWADIEESMYYTPVVLSWGEHSPQLMYNLMSSKMVVNGFYNIGYYSNPTVDKHMNDALLATSDQEANKHWQKAIWDGNAGFNFDGDAAWAWYMNTNHIYFINEKLDIGQVQPQPHGGAILKNICEWKMK